jgi:DNA repair protein SbcD/Mre11
MPRLLHMADVHLGARHDDLGPAAAAQRERQFAAFARAIDLALDEKVDAVLVCGDLFDSNSQPRRSVERAAAEFKRLVERHVPVVVIPGTHDCYDTGSIYRVFDLAEMAGAAPESDMLTVLTDSRGAVDLPGLATTVRAHVFATKRASESPLAQMSVSDAEREAAWQVGMVHGSMAVPGKFDEDEVIFTEQEVAASGLDYLALGHWHSFREGHAGRTVWAYAGAPEPVALDQDGAGRVALVTLEKRDGARLVSVEPRTVGRSRFQKLEIDAAMLPGQVDLRRRLQELADPDLMLDLRLVGVRSEQLDLNLDELDNELAGSFLRLRLRDSSLAPLADPSGTSPDTILGAFTRDLRARIDDCQARGDEDTAAELREALRYGILLLDDPQRVTLA